MQVYLVQHGAAKSEAEDPQRGLTEEGKRNVERMAEYLASLRLALERIEHSGKLRARQTAEILSGQLRPAGGVKEIGGCAPNDNVEPTYNRLQTESKPFMLVGHLPYLSRLVARLLKLGEERAVVQFQMGGVVRLDRDETGRWVVRWVLPPESLPAR